MKKLRGLFLGLVCVGSIHTAQSIGLAPLAAVFGIEATIGLFLGLQKVSDVYKEARAAAAKEPTPRNLKRLKRRKAMYHAFIALTSCAGAATLGFIGTSVYKKYAKDAEKSRAAREQLEQHTQAVIDAMRGNNTDVIPLAQGPLGSPGTSEVISPKPGRTGTEVVTPSDDDALGKKMLALVIKGDMSGGALDKKGPCYVSPNTRVADFLAYGYKGTPPPLSWLFDDYGSLQEFFKEGFHFETKERHLWNRMVTDILSPEEQQQLLSNPDVQATFWDGMQQMVCQAEQSDDPARRRWATQVRNTFGSMYTLLIGDTGPGKDFWCRFPYPSDHDKQQARQLVDYLIAKVNEPKHRAQFDQAFKSLRVLINAPGVHLEPSGALVSTPNTPAIASFLSPSIVAALQILAVPVKPGKRIAFSAKQKEVFANVCASFFVLERLIGLEGLLLPRSGKGVPTTPLAKEQHILPRLISLNALKVGIINRIPGIARWKFKKPTTDRGHTQWALVGAMASFGGPAALIDSIAPLVNECCEYVDAALGRLSPTQRAEAYEKATHLWAYLWP